MQLFDDENVPEKSVSLSAFGRVKSLDLRREIPTRV